MRPVSTIVAAAVLGFASFTMSASAAIVVNGNFEATDTGPGDALGWSNENGSSIVRDATAGVGGSAGIHMVNTTPASALGPVLQITGLQGGDPIVPGESYSLEFDSQRTFQIGGVFQFLVFWRDAATAPIGGPVANVTLPAPTAGFEHVSHSLGVAPDGATQLSIEFFAITGANDGSLSDVIIDNVSVVPEPASLSLLGLGAFGLLVRRRRA